MSSNFRGFLALLLAWPITILCFGTFSIISILTLRRFTSKLPTLTVKVWGSTLLKIAGIRVITHGIEELSEPAPRIIIFNHSSTLDLLWLGKICPPNVIAIAKREFLYIPFFNLLLWSAKSIFLDRKNRDAAVTTLNALAKRIHAGSHSIYIAPEGTRAPAGTILPFKKGPFRLAANTNTPILPLYVSGADKLLPKGENIPKAGEVTITKLPTIPPKYWEEGDFDEQVKKIEALYRDQKQQELDSAQ